MTTTDKIYLNTLKAESKNFFILKMKQASIVVLLISSVFCRTAVQSLKLRKHITLSLFMCIG